eukprot:gene7690-9153_t
MTYDTLFPGEGYITQVLECNETQHFIITLPTTYVLLDLQLEAYTDPIRGVSSVVLEISRNPEFSSILERIEGQSNFLVPVKNVSDFGDYFLRVFPGGLYCPTGYQLRAFVAGELTIFNASFIYQSNVRSRLLPIDKYSSLCSYDYYLENPDKCAGGADRRAAYIQSVQAVEENVICLDSGNAVVGTSFFSTFEGAADAELLMNYAPFDVWGPQHFELNKGEVQLALLLNMLTSTHMVLSNVDWSRTVLADSALQRYAVKEFNGRQVGFLGIVDETYLPRYAPILSEDFVVNPDVQNLPQDRRTAAQLALVVDELVSNHPSCNIIVALGFSDVLCRQVLEQSDNIDICVASAPISKESITTSAMNVMNLAGNTSLYVMGASDWYGRYLGNLWVSFDASGVILDWNKGDVVVAMDHNNFNASDPGVLQRLGEMEDEIAVEATSTVVGTISRSLSGEEGSPQDNSTWPGCRAHECQMGDFLTDAFLYYCQQHFEDSCDVAIMN